MASMYEFFHGDALTKGQTLGIIIAVFALALIVKAVVRDEVLWYTEYEDGTEAEWRARTGKHMRRTQSIELK